MEEATLEIRGQGFGGAEIVKRKERLLSAVLLSQAIAFSIALTSLSSTLLASKVRFASVVAHQGMAHCGTIQGIFSPIGTSHGVMMCSMVCGTLVEAHITPVPGLC